MDRCDVAIIGGGLSGLYSAWRLGTNTNLRVVVLEASSRFGGRFYTCMMPGNFPADLGAMRFLPLSHRLLFQLTQDLGLDIQRFFDKNDLDGKYSKYYYKNQHLQGLDDLVKLCAIDEEDLRYFARAGQKLDLKMPKDGNFYKAILRETGQPAKDVSQSQYMSLSKNQEVLNIGCDHYPNHITLADKTAWLNQFQSVDDSSPLAGYHVIKGGMQSLVDQMIKRLEELPNVHMFKNSPVTMIRECDGPFVISSEILNHQVTADRLILACNARGIEQISWNGPHNRTTHLQHLFSKVLRQPGFKLFLTYKKPWWEEKGLLCGAVETDLPISEVTAFGRNGKNKDFATILASFTYKHTEIFEGLSQPSYERFTNTVGDVPHELVPTQLLVDFVQQQLQKVFGIKELPPPVCAAFRIWSETSIPGNHQSRVGVDTYQLQWEGMKPFADADVYITGDTFTSCTKRGTFIGWSEGVLLNSERIIVNHMGLKPYLPDMPMHNEFPAPAAKL